MSIGYTLKVDDADALAVLTRMVAVGEDLRPVLSDIGGELEGSTVKRFISNVAPDGTPWKASLRAEKTGTPTLVLTSNLRDSIHYVVEPNAVSIGSALVYAAVHQAGFDGEVVVSNHERRFTMVFGRRISGVTNVMPHSRHMKMPARPYLGLSANDREAVVSIVGEHWARAARGGAR